MNKEDLTEPDKVIRLWAHETSRVFMDWLVSDEDEEWFIEMMIRVSRDKNREDLERNLWKLTFNQN